MRVVALVGSTEYPRLASAISLVGGELRPANSWTVVMRLLRNEAIAVVVANPHALRQWDMDAVSRMMLGFPSTPTIVYTSGYVVTYNA